jgi:CopG-like RHH_1 or ribbon-helix-helix domain, RHH_5
MAYGHEDLGVVKRITVTLDDETHQVLQEWADSEARTVPNLLAYLALVAIKNKQQEQVTKDK